MIARFLRRIADWLDPQHPEPALPMVRLYSNGGAALAPAVVPSIAHQGGDAAWTNHMRPDEGRIPWRDGLWNYGGLYL